MDMDGTAIKPISIGVAQFRESQPAGQRGEKQHLAETMAGHAEIKFAVRAQHSKCLVEDTFNIFDVFYYAINYNRLEILAWKR